VEIGSFWLFKELQEPIFLSLLRGLRVSSLATPGPPLPPHSTLFPLEKGSVRATWAGTSSRPSLPSYPSCSDAPRGRPIRRESTPPREPRRAVRPHPATCAAPRAPRPTPRLAPPRLGAAPIGPLFHFPCDPLPHSPRPTSPFPYDPLPHSP
jgi:hypothetical protein